MVMAMSATHAQIPDAETEASGINVFWSGHSLTRPITTLLQEISTSLGRPMNWNGQHVGGSSIEVRTRGREPGATGWAGYKKGFNRDSEDLDVLAELHSPVTVPDGHYDALVITEVHILLWALLGADTVRLLRHYHERFIEGNPQGQTYFYESWLDMYDKDNPRKWIDYERAASPVWQCVATRINHSLAAEGRSDRIASLPAAAGLAELVDKATSPPGVPGITSTSTRETLDRLFEDNVHPTTLGAYYVALVSYGFLFDADPAGAWAPPDVSETQAASLQSLAWEFVSDYRKNNKPLDLEGCRELIRDSFADRYWRYVFDGYRRPDDPWLRAFLARAKHNAQRIRNVYRWRRGFAEDAPDNPLRYDPSKDGSYWHSAP